MQTIVQGTFEELPLLEDILFVETRNNPGSYFGANDRGAQSQSLKDQGKSRTSTILVIALILFRGSSLVI
mgnify:CR=1